MPSPRSSSRIQPATLSRKYLSWVTAITVPLYCFRYNSSHSTDSASRWLVGSSRSKISGSLSSRRHKATRRRSPPERNFTGVSPSGQRKASMARSSFESSSQASLWSINSVSLPCRSMSAFISSSVIGSENLLLHSSYSFRMSTTSCTPSSTT